MTVRIRITSPVLQSRNSRGWSRRAFIYPHRSVRSVPAGAARSILAGLSALALTSALVLLLTPLLEIHNKLCMAILQLSGISIIGTVPVRLFGSLGTGPVPIIAAPELSSRPLELWLMFTAAALVLLELWRRIPFGRSFLIFVLFLLVVAAGVIVFFPSSQFGSAEFAGMWLRSELLVWLVLPCLTAGLFILSQPTALFGVAWAVLTQVYGFLWSAIRLAFGIAVIHYTGILFTPIFWFAAGLLADVIYLVVFYSVSVQWAARSSWGKRT